MVRNLRLLIVGFGAVGQALAEQLQRRRGELRERIGNVSVVGVCDSRGSVVDPRGLDLQKLIRIKRDSGAVGERGTPDALSLMGEVKADVLVELASAGGLDGEPGLSRIRKALDQGMHVVSSNKMPLAVAYESLTETAKARGLILRYGACVGGGVSVIEFGEACAASESVTRIDGVLNATTNYILTQMEQGKKTFEEALGQAQRAGFAEADPSLDIDGFDAACKIVIIGNTVLGRRFTLKGVTEVSGIRGVTQGQIEATRGRGRRLRLVATADETARVGLVELPEKDRLVVDGASHAVRFQTSLGDRFVGGEGAGGISTSSAVLRDITYVGGAI